MLINKIEMLTLGLAASAASLHAQNIWQGANSLIGTDTNINDGANWSGGTVPGTGEMAVFEYYGDALSKTALSIGAADTDFDPSGLTFSSNVGTNNHTQTSDLIIDKSLTLTDGLILNASGGNSANRDNDRLRIGSGAFGITWDVESFTFSSYGYSFIQMGIGDDSPNNAATLNLTGANVTIDGSNLVRGSVFGLSGNVAVENETNTKAPLMAFTNTGGTVNLLSGGQQSTGSLGLGGVRLAARSDQTWTADATSFVTLYGSAGAVGFAGKYLVESIDGGRLDNLDVLNIRIEATQSTSNDATRAMRMFGGTYGSLLMSSATTSGRTQWINQTDDVTFAAAAVGFDEFGDSYASPYSMWMENDIATEHGSDTQIYDTQGFDLNLTNGLLFLDTASTTQADRPIRINAEGSNITIGGDVLWEAPNRRPDSGGTVQNQMSLDGGATGANVTLGGSWDVRVVGSSQDNLKNSIFTMTGDSATFEVADASGTSGVAASSWGLGTFHVGGAADPASVQLVNDYLNDNPFNGDANVDKVGEMLIAGLLNINPNSTLNVNGLNVEVGDFTMDPTATLDLATGVVLSDGAIIESFIGLGDQVSDWQVFESQVVDSFNPLFEFTAVLDGGNTKWQAALVPEPSTYTLIFASLAGALVMYRRRRS